jgi:hypothetical protein
MKFREVAYIFWLLSSKEKFYAFILAKTGWATFWAIFFKNTSGHPGCA